MDYLNFDLLIGFGQGAAYPLSVVRSPAGEARATLHLPFDAPELARHLHALELAVPRQGLAPEAVRDFGRALFDALLAGEVRSRYDVSRREAERQGCGLRLRLRVRPPELVTLPWEFLYDPRQGEYVGLSRHTPLVRYQELPRPIPPMTVTPPLRVLGMTASPRDLPPLNIEAERRRMAGALAPLADAGLVDLVWLAGETWRDLQRAMRRGRWHVFHFIGHGGFDGQAGEGYVAVPDAAGATRRLRATELGRLLADHPALRLALLNACEGARGSREDVFSSVASALVRRGLPAVLAMQHAIPDRAAVEFARTFYEALADGVPVDAATTEARLAVSLALPGSFAWGTPVLSMRADDGRLFAIASPDAGRPATPAPLRPAPSAPSTAPPVALYRQLVQHLGEDELATLCFYVGVDYDRLGGEGRRGRARELLELLAAQGRIPALVEAGRQLRPDVDWAVAPAAVPSAHMEPGAAAPPDAAAGDGLRSASAGGRRVDPLFHREPFEPELVLIPAGPFSMGSDPQKGEYAPEDEQPQHALDLPDYYLAKTPVTNAQYAAFVVATGHRCPAHWQDDEPPPDRAAHPVVDVSWRDAVAYCRWLAHVTGKPYALPSEAEWEKGARGDDGRIYPWGSRWDARRCNTEEGRHEDTTPVDAFPLGASAHRLLDMAGNVWEWTRSLWGGAAHEPAFKYPYVAQDGREALEAGDAVRRVLRGGSFNYGRESARCACRNRLGPTSRSWYVGFRVGIAAGGEA